MVHTQLAYKIAPFSSEQSANEACDRYGLVGVIERDDGYPAAVAEATSNPPLVTRKPTDTEAKRIEEMLDDQ